MGGHRGHRWEDMMKIKNEVRDSQACQFVRTFRLVSFADNRTG